MGKKLCFELKGHYASDGTIISPSLTSRLVFVDMGDKKTLKLIEQRTDPETGHKGNVLVEKDGKSWWRIVKIFEPFDKKAALHDGTYPIAHEIKGAVDTYMRDALLHTSGKYPHGFFQRPDGLKPVRSNVKPSKTKKGTKK